MNDKELQNFLRSRYGINFPESYVHFANAFSQMDKQLKDLQTHHVCPRCCGGDNYHFNLIRVSFHHHRKLHQLILQTKELSEEQKSKLTFAYQKMRKG